MDAPAGIEKLDVLLIEDEEIDALIVRRHLPDVQVRWARNAREGLAAARLGNFDAALVDLNLPDSDAETVVPALLEAMGMSGPVLILTGTEDDALADRWVGRGVDDYIAKHELARSRLSRRVSMAVQRYRVRRNALSWEERVADWARKGELLFEWDLRHNTVDYDDGWREHMGVDADEDSIRAWFDRVHPDDHDILGQAIASVLEESRPGAENRHRLEVSAGHYRWFAVRLAVCMDGQSEPTRVLGSHTDVTAECDNPCHACGHDNPRSVSECAVCSLPLESAVTGDAFAETVAEDGGRHGWTGRMVAGRFVIGRNIGAGGAGAVYLANDTSDNEAVAIKLLHPWLLESQEARDRFMAEGEMQQGLLHPNLVRVIDVGHSAGAYYIATEFARDGSLLDLLRTRGKLPEVTALRLFIPLIRGVAYAHENEIVHRDIKPANILIDRVNGEMVARLTDFGVAKLAPQQAMTQTGAVIGTLRYMAPEQFHDAKHADGRSDVYSLAATLHQAITGRVPYGAHLPQGNAPPAPVSASPARASAPVSALLSACLSPDPDDRPSGCLDLADRLERHLVDLE